ncbi:MAG: hypothetical protein GY871_03575 [Actinomycetales bacterium]|nr:hypothetical protein [Actinomycetales bacterium]
MFRAFALATRGMLVVTTYRVAHHEGIHMTNANSIFWAAMRQRDVLGGLAIFLALNSALFAIVILASDISSSGQVALAIFAVLSNFLVWLWNDAGIKDVHAGSKDIAGDDAETAIAQEFKKAPWAFYRGIVVVIALATAGSLLYALFG